MDTQVKAVASAQLADTGRPRDASHSARSLRPRHTLQTDPRRLLLSLAVRGCASGLLPLFVTAPAIAQSAPAPTDEAWHFAVTPYLWMAGLNGSTRIGPLAPQNVDAPFSDVVGNLSAALMGAFEARKNRRVILLDTFYVSLSQTSGPLLGGELGNAKVKLNQRSSASVVGIG